MKLYFQTTDNKLYCIRVYKAPRTRVTWYNTHNRENYFISYNTAKLLVKLYNNLPKDMKVFIQYDNTPHYITHIQTLNSCKKLRKLRLRI